jgi:hypothetical protein
VKGIARVGLGLDGLRPVRRGAGPHSSKVSIFFSNTSTTPNLKTYEMSRYGRGLITDS